MTLSLDSLNVGRTLPVGNTISASREFFNLTGSSFAEIARDVAARAQAGADVDFASRIDANTVTFEEYKSWVKGCIDGMELSESRQGDSIAVEIPDEGIRQMKNDPDYANWVLNEIRRDFAAEVVTKDETNAYATTRLNSALDQFNSERWLSPFYDDWGLSSFDVKSKNSLWIRMSSNLEQANLIAQAQRKQAEMAAQMLLQEQTARFVLGR